MMISQAIKALSKSLGVPDKTRPLGRGQAEIVTLEETTIARVTLRPGWQWSVDARPAGRTGSCDMAHCGYVISGCLAVRMDDGTLLQLKSGDAFRIPPGHDAWVIGDRPCVFVDFEGFREYGKAV
jgi:hypothetical protein